MKIKKKLKKRLRKKKKTSNILSSCILKEYINNFFETILPKLASFSDDDLVMFSNICKEFSEEFYEFKPIHQHIHICRKSC